MLDVSFYKQVFIVIQDDKSLYYFFGARFQSWKTVVKISSDP